MMQHNNGTTGTAVQQHGAYDPYAAYGASATQNKLYLSFKNGEYLYGANDEEVPLGTRFVANMAGLTIGWKRWSQKKATDEIMHLLTDPTPQKRRSDLGDHDQAMWEIDEKDGKKRDPWQFANELTLVGIESGDEFIFAVSSKGGIGAVGELCKTYGSLYRQRPGMVPVIELQRDSYQHKEFGKTYFPVLKLVDWVSDVPRGAVAAHVEVAPEQPQQVAPPPAAPPPPPVATQQPATTTGPKRTRF